MAGVTASGFSQETVRLIDIGFDLANELESVDVGRFGSNQEPTANGVGESLVQNIRRLRFIGTKFTPESGFNQLNAGELGH